MKQIAIFLAAALCVTGSAWASGNEDSRFAVSLSTGLVDTDLENESFLSIAFRSEIGSKSENRRGGDDGLVGAIEVEASTWDGDVVSDESLGVNLLGLSRFSRTEYFFGAGAAIHQLDFEQGGDDDVLGVNFHVGVDVFLNENLSLFGSGRVDLLEDVSEADRERFDGEQVRIALGLRLRF